MQPHLNGLNGVVPLESLRTRSITHTHTEKDRGRQRGGMPQAVGKYLLMPIYDGTLLSLKFSVPQDRNLSGYAV